MRPASSPKLLGLIQELLCSVLGTEIPRRCEWLKPALEPGIHSHRTEDAIQR